MKPATAANLQLLDEIARNLPVGAGEILEGGAPGEWLRPAPADPLTRVPSRSALMLPAARLG